MKSKDLCLALAKSETELEIINILKKEGYWENSESWQYFGDDENNFSIIGNQQSKAESALVEKIINSVDAILMAECLKRGIKFDSKEAPQSIKEALIKYFNIESGMLVNISERERGRLSEHICLIATGGKTHPTYTLIDNGEGQSPARLKDTILSLRKSNKLRVPFVQGKFNMGGTGVFRFCGESNIQFVVSKRQPEIAARERDPMGDFWGYTVIRREDPKAGVRSSNYKYLAPSSHVLCFQESELPIRPSKYPNAYGSPFRYGTFMKFFEYKIGPGLRTNILFDLYNKLSLLMPNLALPIKMYERRAGYTGNSFESVLSGLSVRVNEDRSNNIEENFPASGCINPNGQRMNYSIYVFKKDHHEKYKKDEGIIFTVNGQTHGFISKSFFNRKNVGLGYLAESILIILDCTDIQGRAREDLFMNSRDRLSNHPIKKEIEDELETLLKDHEGLRALKEKRRKEEVQSKLQDSHPLVEVLEDILKKSPTLSRLFIQGLQLHNPLGTAPAESTEEYHGKEFPSYFTLIKKFPQELPKKAHLNSRFRIDYKTDVSNDYLGRIKDPGIFKLYINDIESANETINLWNGYAYLNVKMEDYTIGELIYFRSELIDVSRAWTFKEDFFIQVMEPLPNKEKQGIGGRKPSNSTQNGSGALRVGQLALPQVVELSKDNRSGHSWAEQDFNEFSALKVKGNEKDGYDFFINIDNIHLHTELKNVKNKNIDIIKAKYKFGLILIGIALLNGNFEGIQNDEEPNLLNIIFETTKALSPVIIPMIESLGSLELSDIESVPEEQE